MNPYQIAKSYAEDIDFDGDVYERVCEIADSSQEVIYYATAHDFVRALSGDDEAEAIDVIQECGIEPSSYDDWAQKITYFALVNLMMEELS